MSHQMKVAAQIKNLISLKAALTELGLNFEENGMLVDYRGNNLNAVDLLVTAGGKTNRVGFKWNESAKEYELVGDFYNLNQNQKSFQDSVKQTYVKIEIASQLRAKRYSILKSKKTTEGQIIMRVRKAA